MGPDTVMMDEVEVGTMTGDGPRAEDEEVAVVAATEAAPVAAPCPMAADLAEEVQEELDLTAARDREDRTAAAAAARTRSSSRMLP